ncbi:MAG: glycoside hydrolase family 28 protein [Candidatus Hydrogenedentes bacterium]|nr:glycoside hydrolase family 28 protein [Candidatus Hydrogenedentota bacterium]
MRTLASALLLVFCAMAIAQTSLPPSSPYAVRAFGAVGDGVAKDTAAVQKAIDACSAGGGGTVYFAPGSYLCGSLHLKSNVTLYLDTAAVIKGSKDIADYDPYEELGFENDADRETSFFHQSLIWGEGVEHIGIVGSGTIDSNYEHRGGPKAVGLKRCKYVEIRGIHVINIPNYAISMLGTDYVTIDGVTIQNGFADGIDPDACQNVRISNCHIETFDDAIVPKASFSLGERRACENITVTNCFLGTACSAFKLGTESGGDFKRIAVSNCVMSGLEGRRPAISGISLESVDGSNIDGVVISNCTMVDCRAPVFIRLGNRGRDMDTPTPGTVRNISINNIVSTGASLSCSVAGLPGHNIEGVTLSDIRVRFVGGGPHRSDEEVIPEYADEYPEATMFGGLPSYGLYARHVAGLTLRNVQVFCEKDYWVLSEVRSGKIRWRVDGGMPEPAALSDPGHAVVCDDVTGLVIDDLKAQASPDGASVMRLINVRDAMVRNSAAPANAAVFVEVAGEQSAGIALLGNDFSRAQAGLKLDAKTSAEVVRAAGNLEK